MYNLNNVSNKIEIDLSNPIFVVYIDIKGRSRQSAVEHIENTKRYFDIYKNITIWIIASDVSKIECVYDGQNRNRDIEISNLIKEINCKIDILSKSNSFDDFKINVRDWRINELINPQI